MDLTPDVIHDVAFQEARKGYNTQEVDDFLEKLADGAARMQSQMREMRQRLDGADARVAEAERRAVEAQREARTQDEADEALRRTLVLAQRTADAAIKEAEEQASRTRAEAQEEADRILTEAQEHAQGPVLEELHTLERRRDELRAEVEALDAHLEAQRERVEVAVRQLQRVLKDRSSLRRSDPPEPSDAPAPEPAAAAPEPQPEPPAAAPDPQPEPPAPRRGPRPEAQRAARQQPEGRRQASAPPRPAQAPRSPEPDQERPRPASRPLVPPPESASGRPSGPGPEPAPVDPDAAPAARPGARPGGPRREASGPRARAVGALPGRDVDDDAYLAELRKAMTDQSPLGPRDEDAGPLGAGPRGARTGRSRFGRRT